MICQHVSGYDFEALNVEGQTLYYNITSSTDKTVELTYRASWFSSYEGFPVIPDTVSHDSVTYSVTRIGDSAFYGVADLKDVVIPNFIVSIGTRAFSSCMSLDCVVIPNSVTSIGNSVFTSCWLNEIHWTPNANIIDGYESGLCGSYTLPILYLYRNSENAGILDDVISSLEGEFKEIIVVDGSYSSSVKRVEEEIAHKESIIYDLQGRQVEHPSRGIYIVNGVKRYMK